MATNDELEQIENAIEQHEPATSIAAIHTPFDDIVEFVGRTVAATSCRVYGQTFRAWKAWCDENEIDYLNISAGNVWQFLADGETTMATRNRQLSAMRKFAEILVILDGEPARRLYDALKLLKAPKPSDEIVAERERSKTALSPAQVDLILRHWRGNDLTSRRNLAIIATLAATGIRRSELAKLQWRDVDFERGIIHVRHGKRDKSRDVAIVSEFAIRALEFWHDVQRSANDGDEPRQYVFCSIAGKSGKLGKDRPTTDKTIYRVVEQTARETGVEFTPHDLRRTFGTEYLNTGGMLADLQEQFGHSDESTTLRYAQAVNAERRADNVHFRFGAVTKFDELLFSDAPLFDGGDR